MRETERACESRKSVSKCPSPFDLAAANGWREGLTLGSTDLGSILTRVVWLHSWYAFLPDTNPF